MHDSTDSARLTRPQRAHLLAAALLLSVVSVTGCAGSPGTAGRPVPLASPPGRPGVVYGFGLWVPIILS